MQHNSPTGPSDPIALDPESLKARRTRKFKLAMAAIGAAFFVAMDLVLGSFGNFQQQTSFRTAHPYYHHGLRPNRRRDTEWGRRSYEMATNSLGFRDRGVRDVPLQSDKRRIVLLGDSMIEGLGVQFNQTVAAQLEALWADNNVEVLNAAVVSYSPRLYELKTRWLLEEAGLQFDALIVFIDISDIQDEIFYEAFQPERKPPPAEPQGNWWLQRSLTANVIAQFATRRRKISNEFRTDAEINVWMEGTEAYLNADRDPELGRFEWTLNNAIYKQWGEKGLALAKRHMAMLSELCRRHHIEMSVVVYPSPAQIYAADKDSRQVRFWRDFCEEYEHPFVNLFPTFINDKYSGPREVYESHFIAHDMHWSSAGHKLVAQTVADELEAFAAQSEDTDTAQP